MDDRLSEQLWLQSVLELALPIILDDGWHLMLCSGLRRFTGAINRINSHVQGYVEAHSKGRIKFVDCRSLLLSESEDIDEELMPDSAYPNASGENI